MDPALEPLDLVAYSDKTAKPPLPAINTEALAECLEGIVQQAANLINEDVGQEFLYKNPNGWRAKYVGNARKYHKITISEDNEFSDNSNSSSGESFAAPSPSTASDDVEYEMEPWALIQDFDFRLSVHQINEFIQTWKLTPATKFVVIALDKVECFRPFGKRYFVEAHFSKPTPKCPNPLAVAKVYFHINVSHLLPGDYPVNVTYKFEGYNSQFYAMGKHKMHSNTFQRYFIDSILHMKLTFYAELCECRNPLPKTMELYKRNCGTLGDTF